MEISQYDLRPAFQGSQAGREEWGELGVDDSSEPTRKCSRSNVSNYVANLEDAERSKFYNVILALLSTQIRRRYQILETFQATL